MSYADEIRQKITSDLRARAREHDAGGLPFVAAVCRETADNIDRAVARATAEGLRRIGVAVAVWAGMAAVQQRVVSVEARARAATYAWNLESRALAAERAARRKWELRLRWRAENSYEQRHPNLYDIDRLYRHEVCAQRDAQKNTERLGSGITRFRWYFDAARRLPIAGPRGVLP